MKFPTIALLSISSLVSAQRTYNITSALAEGQWEKYKCLTTERWLPQVPECLRKCTIESNKKDCCAYDDFACHCIHYQTYADIIEPCVLPPELGGRGGGCTLDELHIARPLVTDMCNFFNATLYAAYMKCPRGLQLSPLKTLKTVFSEDTEETT